MARFSSLVRAFGSLTITAAPADTNTVTIGGKVYTYQTTLTNVDGNVLIGASGAISLQNLQAAINLGTGAGTLYATAMTINANVRARTPSATVLVVEAKAPGAVGNFIATTETHANATWGAATLASGAGSISVVISELRTSGQLNADALAVLDVIDGNSEA